MKHVLFLDDDHRRIAEIRQEAERLGRLWAAEAGPAVAPVEPAPPGLEERVARLEDQVAELQRRLEER